MFRQGQNSYPTEAEQLSRRGERGRFWEAHNRAAAVLHNKKGGQKI